MESIIYLFPALILIVGITLAYETYRKRTREPRISRSFVTWTKFLILVIALALGARMETLDKFGIVAFAAVISGAYIFLISPRIRGIRP
jgi:hypothetical protein